MRFSTVLLAVTASTTCLAVPAPEGSRYVLHEKRDAAPHMWNKRSRAHASEVLPVRIGLTQRNLHKAEDFIMDVSDPKSPNFGQFQTSQSFGPALMYPRQALVCRQDC